MVPVLTLGAVLEGFISSVDDTIQNAIKSAKDAMIQAEIEAGRQVEIAIYNAKNAYKDSLDQTADKVNESIQKSVDQLKSMVQELQSKNQKLISELAKKVQQYIITLPFANKQTQLTEIKPKYVIVDSNKTDVFFKLTGVFLFASKHKPTLTFPGVNKDGKENKFEAINSTTQEIEFHVPISMIIKNETGALYQSSFAQGTFNAPWVKEGWVWNSVVDAIYKLYVATLPLLVGTIKVIYSKPREERTIKDFSSDSLSAVGEYPKTWITREFTVFTDPEYQVVQGSAKFKIDKKPGHNTPHGKWSQEIEEKGDRVICRVKCGGSSGKNTAVVDFHIEFKETKINKVFDKREENIELKWGNSQILEAQPDEEIKIIFDSSRDGHHAEFAGPNLDDDLKVTNEGGKFKIAAPVPDEFVDEFVEMS